MMTKKLVSLLLALAMALSMAACSPAQTETTPVPAVETPEPVAEEPQGEAPQPEEGTVLEADVLVIGCGLSGLTSSLAAAQNGASVITLEKMAFAGGNAILSTGILQAAGSSLQAKAGIEDSPEKYLEDMRSGDAAKRDPVQMELVAARSGNTIDWLMENGVEFSETVSQGVGSTAFRAHQSQPDATELISGLLEAVEPENVKLLYETPATALLTAEDGSVTGATAVDAEGRTLTVHAKSVIIASGGFGGSPEMLEKYWGEKYARMTYAGSPGTTGEMIEAAAALGAKLTDMEEAAYGSPTVDVEKIQLVTAMVLSGGAILTNGGGERFCNETGNPYETAASVVGTGEPCVYEVFDSQVFEKVYKCSIYKNMGILMEADTLEELADKAGLPIEALLKTVEDYNAAVGGAEDPYGRTIFTTKMDTPPYYCVKVAAGGVMTFGGLTIDESCRVLKEDGTAIGGLYAAGEATGGYRAYGYVCGDANIHAAVTGRTAGEAAAQN